MSSTHNCLFQNKTHLWIREFSHELSKLFPNNPEVSTAHRKKKKQRLLEAFLRGRWGHWDLSGFLGEAARGWRSWSTTGNLRNSKFKKSPQKLNLKFEDFGWRLLEDAWSFSMFLEMFEKCFDDGLRCLNMVNDAWCVWSCLGFWWILRFCHRGLWCDENVWRRCVQLFRDGWSCFKTFKMPKRRLKMAENVKSCLRIIQDGLWCFQRYLKMLLKVAWKMVKDS